MKNIAFILILLALSAQAEIYRSVDKDGNVVFTDEPQGDAEIVDLPPAMVYTAEPQAPLDSETGTDKQTEEATVYYQVSIVSPSANEAIWSNNGSVTISVLVEPSIKSEEGEQLSVSLAGETQLLSDGASSAQFENISRGTHTATATVVNAEGVSLGQSASVTFHIHRASAN